MRKRIGIIAGIWIIGALLIGSGGMKSILPIAGEGISESVYAGKGSLHTTEISAGKTTSSEDIQSKIDEANKEKQSIEEEKKQLKEDIASIEAKKENVVEYIEGLDGKLADLSEKIEKNKEESVMVKARIRTLEKEAKQARQDKKKQYDIMSKRIKYIYENGNEGYLELLLGSNSLSELFNRAEYVSKVTNYDNQMLKKYQSVCDKLEKSQKELKSRLTQLTNLKASLQVEKESVNLIVDKKTKELNKYQSLAAEKNSQISNRNHLLQQQENTLESLMVEQRRQWEAEEKKKAAAEKKKAAAEKKQEKAKTNKSTSKNSQSNNQNNSSSASNQTNNQSSSTNSSGGYGWPLTASGRISSYFGYRDAPTEGASTYHKGIDVAVPSGTGVLATKAGTVVTSAYSSSAGYYIAISHGNGVYSYYMHCSKLLVSKGKSVSKGQKIALSGNSGISTGAHLHFAIYANGSYVNPLNYVSR